MIDKKPFRVTNEQVRALKGEGRSTNCEDCDTCPASPLCESNIRVSSILAADLLDARELIDKQESIIKGMRVFIDNAFLLQEKQAIEAGVILDKTKDYV